MPKRPTRGRRKAARGIEWVGGFALMPAYVTGEGEPYRPEVLLWIGADGLLLGVTVDKPGVLLPAAGELLQQTIDHPVAGPPHSPTRVRVASQQLADVLRAEHPGLDIVCAPTPELDDVLAAMREHMDMDEGTDTSSLLSDDISSEAMGSFFAAAAALYRVQPWKQVPDDDCLFSITAESFGLRDAVMSVIGQMGQSFGLVLFSSIDDFELYLDAAQVLDLDGKPHMPRHTTLNFDRGADIPPAVRKEIAAHGWELAGADAYPSVFVIDPDLVCRLPSANELAMIESIVRALTRLLGEKRALRKAWTSGEPITRTARVRSHRGETEVTLSTPHVGGPAEVGFSHELLSALAELAASTPDDDEIDPDTRERLEDDLMRLFAASPEAGGQTDLAACRFVMDFAANYFGATIATLGPAALREIMFEIVPRKVSVPASEARWIIETISAFYRFLGRECGLMQAEACLKVLGPNALPLLEAALADSGNFGLAKSLVMAGADAGFDLDSPAGIEAWMQSISGKPLPASIQLPSLSPAPTKKKAAKKKAAKKKAAKKKAAKKKTP